MIPNDHSLLLFKFSEYRHNRSIYNGELSFSCIGKYIKIAKQFNNDEQGDNYEAIFAKLYKDDPRIGECKRILGRDLEIIEEGEFIKLRRYSSYRIPTFCFYSLRPEHLLESENIHEGFQKIRVNLDSRIFEAFTDKINHCVLSNDYVYSHLILQPAPFMEKLKNSFNNNRGKYVLKYIDYNLRKEEVFFIEPTADRNELFCKDPKYKYQNEARICILDKRLNTINDRYSIKIQPFTKEEASLITNELYFEIEANVGVYKSN